MKAYLSLLLLCCLFGINKGQVTVAQAVGTWAGDSSSNTAIPSACCVPATLAIAAGTSSSLSSSGTWGTTTSCTTNGISGGTFSNSNTAYAPTSTASALAIPFTYVYNFASTGQTLVGLADYSSTGPTAGTITMNLNMNSATCSVVLTAPVSNTAFLSTSAANWAGQYTGTVTQTDNCCFPVLSTTASTDSLTNVKITGTSSLVVAWTWDTTSTKSAAACAKQGLSGAASVTIPAASITTVSSKTQASLSGLTTSTISLPSIDTFSSSTAASWTYVTNGQSCTWVSKKTSSSASNLYISFAGLILLFVAYL